MDPGVPSETSLPYTAEVLPGTQAEQYEPYPQPYGESAPLAFQQDIERYDSGYPETAEQPTRSRWFMLLRPQTLLFSIGPIVVVLTLLWAQGIQLALLPALCLLLAATLILAGANMLDEYLD